MKMSVAPISQSQSGETEMHPIRQQGAILLVLANLRSLTVRRTRNRLQEKPLSLTKTNSSVPGLSPLRRH